MAGLGGAMIETSREDRRTLRRFAVSLQGRIFCPNGAVKDCILVDISSAGAAVQCASLPDGSEVSLQVEKIGRINAVCTSHEKGILRLRFECPEATRQHIAMTLGQFLETGRASALRPRRENRLATANFHFTRANGERVPCDALDISLRGISVRTTVKPPIGEFVVIGRSAGRVVRHHDQGIGIQFETPGAPAAHRIPRSYHASGQQAVQLDNLV
jgi:hypothetical protein